MMRLAIIATASQLAACLPSSSSSSPLITDRYARHIEGAMLAQFDLEPFVLDNLSVSCMKEQVLDDMFTCSIRFDWSDPNAADSTCCEYSWEWDGQTFEHDRDRNNYNTDYYVCSGSNSKGDYFQYMFSSYQSEMNFTLMLSHSFRDSKDFETSQTVAMYAPVEVTLQYHGGAPLGVVYRSPGPIEARVLGMSL